MADKHAPLILEALTRAASEPGGLPPHAARGEVGRRPNPLIRRARADREPPMDPPPTGFSVAD